MATSCSEKELIETENASQSTKVQTNYSSLRETGNEENDKEMILGKKLQNPYTIENMKKALENVNASRSEKLSLKIEPNYLYVRFLPKNDDEYVLISRDKNLELYNYPLDYEIIQRGNKYKDPSLKEDSYTWQYAALKPTINFQN